ncbi:hypothetical protein TH8_19810 [Thalassospira profundimaris]|nr:hypothetical protein TH8_19810 [Thalassospira profundimaris]
MSIKQAIKEMRIEDRRISVCAKRFYAAWQFISTEETRYYLNGVFIEPHPDGGVLMVATDGHVFAAVHDRTAYIEGDGGWICSVPKSPFTSALKRRDAGTLHFVGNTTYLTDSIIGIDARHCRFDPTKITEQHKAIAYAPPIDGTFPDWRKIVPQGEAKPTHRFAINGRHFEKFTKAIETLSESKCAALSFSTPKDGQSPILIQSGNARDFFGIVMPMRDDYVAEDAPEWLNLPKPEATPEPANDTKPSAPEKARPVLGLKTPAKTANDAEAELVKSGQSVA